MKGDTVHAHTISKGRPGAPLVVLAHGLEESWTSWQPVAARLDPSWRLVALDLPWRPGNDYHWLNRPAAQWLGDAFDLLDARPDTTIAHSFGANATLHLMCALDPRPGPSVALVCPVYRQPHHQVTWKMFDRARITFVEHIKEGLRARLGARLGTVDPDIVEKMMSMALERIGPSGFLTVFQQYIASSDLELELINQPTMLVAGGADPTLSPRAARALGARIPGTDLRITDSYDHFCHIRHPSGVAAQVAEFISDNSYRTVKELR